VSASVAWKESLDVDWNEGGWNGSLLRATDILIRSFRSPFFLSFFSFLMQQLVLLFSFPCWSCRQSLSCNNRSLLSSSVLILVTVQVSALGCLGARFGFGCLISLLMPAPRSGGLDLGKDVGSGPRLHKRRLYELRGYEHICEYEYICELCGYE